MTRRRLVVLAVAPTLVVGMLVAVGILAGSRAVQADVDVADDAAASYRAAHARFVASARKSFEEADVEDPREVARVARGLADDLPRLGDAPRRGIDGSGDYRAAEQEAAALREAVAGLRRTARAGRAVRTFVLAANDALAIDPQAILPEAAFANGTPVRQRLVPRVRGALDTFAAVEVPEGAGPVAADVRAALTTLLEEAETLAAELDAGRGYRFEYGRALGVAQAAVEGLAESVRGDLRESVDRVLEPSTTA